VVKQLAKLTATLPTGEVVTRLTARSYTHVVVYTTAGEAPTVLAWCGSQALAAKQLKHWTGRALAWHVPSAAAGAAWEITIVEVARG